jgi:hypothetical protein
MIFNNSIHLFVDSVQFYGLNMTKTILQLHENNY